MTDKEIKAEATKLFNSIKKKILSAKKYNKENHTESWNRASQMANIEVYSNDKWANGNRYVESYSIYVDRQDKESAKAKTFTDAKAIFDELYNMLNELKKTKGWGGLTIVWEQLYFSANAWLEYKLNGVSKVCLPDAVCKEYTSLQNYINKYGKGDYGNVNLKNYELFSSAMGGKRGVLWDEYGERYFLDNKPKKCSRLLEELRKNRGAKDTMFCKRGTEDYIDEMERQYSEYYEVECDGEKRNYLEITIKTPSGKVKYTTKIY